MAERPAVCSSSTPICRSIRRSASRPQQAQSCFSGAFYDAEHTFYVGNPQFLVMVDQPVAPGTRVLHSHSFQHLATVEGASHWAVSLISARAVAAPHHART